MSLFGEPITSFSGEYRFLSNFWPVNITGILAGRSFPSVEHAYVASKSTDSIIHDRLSCSNMTAAQAKSLGRTLDIRPDWDDVKFTVMCVLVRKKFEYPELAKLLLATGDRPLIEGNTWGDVYWGQCPIGKGQNNLGKILEHNREILGATTI